MRIVKGVVLGAAGALSGIAALAPWRRGSDDPSAVRGSPSGRRAPHDRGHAAQTAAFAVRRPNPRGGRRWSGLHTVPASLTASSAASADPRPVPVTTGVVEIQDFPIYRIGVGTVQAYNTVTVRVRVDGEIQTIAFREGQDVPAISLRRLIRARRRLSCIRRRR